jgi:TnpA family transposase
MGRRDLLSAEERRRIFGVPTERDDLARFYTFEAADLDLIGTRREDRNRLGFGVQLALLRHPGLTLAQVAVQPDVDLAPMTAFVAEQLRIPAEIFRAYGARDQTRTDHAREVATALGLRSATRTDLPLLIEAAAAASWATDKGGVIVTAMIAALREAKIMLPAPATIERAGVTGRAKARTRTYAALLAGLGSDQIRALDALSSVGTRTGLTRLTELRTIPVAAKPDHVGDILAQLQAVRALGIDPLAESRVHPDRLARWAREGRLSPAYLMDRYTTARRRATIVALLLDLEARLIDAAIEMADKLIGGAFTRAKNAQARQYTSTARDVGRLMRMFRGTIDALVAAAGAGEDPLHAVDEAVGWAKLLRARGEVAEIADAAGVDPLVRAADRHATLRKFAPALLEALEFKAACGSDKTVAAVHLLRELAGTHRREVPRDAPMPFKKEWHALVIRADGRIDRRLYETAVLAHLRNKLRSGDVWVERSSAYRRFDSYMLASAEVVPITSELGLPATADAWLESRARELDRRLKRFADRLGKGKLDGVAMRDGRLSITPVRAIATPEAKRLAERLDALMPRARITELLHEAARGTGFLSAFTNLRTGDPCPNENALLAAILADATNLGLARMAEASQGVTRDQLVWTADAYLREETYKAALARIIDAHHALPISAVWGDGTTSSSDGQFFRSGKRGAAAGEINARYGVDPGFSFYTHVSDQHAPYHVRVISAATHEAPYVLDGLLHHGSSLPLAEHYTDTGGATDHVFALCAMLGFRFCPRLRDFPDRRLIPIAPPTAYPALAPLLGKKVRADVVREHWGEILRLVASLKAGHAAPSVMLKKLAAYERQNQLDLALQEVGKVERTLFMLDWLENPVLRQRCQAGLNKSEQRHQLTQALYTFRQGRLVDRSHEAQQYRASGLNLVIASIVWWNTTYIADGVDHLRGAGEQVRDEVLAHTSPVGWEHIAFSGDFLWDRAAALPHGRRPLNLGRTTRRVA